MPKTSVASAQRAEPFAAPSAVTRQLMPARPRHSSPLRALLYRLAALNIRKLRYAFARLWFCGIFYPLTLRGIRPRQIAFEPPAPWSGDADRGMALLRNVFTFGGETVEQSDAVWRTTDSGEDWLVEMHGFDWLRDLNALGSDIARVRARELVSGWIDTQKRWRNLPWRPDVLGNRLVNWLTHVRFLFDDGDETLAPQFLESVARQVRHLRRIVGMVDGPARFAMIEALIFASLCLRSEARRRDRWIKLLVRELDAQIAGDGGHFARSPAVQFRVFRRLVEIRDALAAARAPVPEPLQHAIDRMAPMLRFFRHGDGGLALFNGTDEGESWLIDLVLVQAGARGKPLSSAPHTGYQRAAVNRTLVLMDTGSVCPPGRDANAHAGTLSFEMSVGRERLIVNCGAYLGPSAPWKIAQRTTAAHSTVTVGDMNSSEILSKGRIGRRARVFDIERKESEGNVWIEAGHDGYRRSFGVIHRRRLYVAASGADIRGEDTLEGKGSHKFAIRFHLHPAVKASLVKNGTSVLLRLPGGTGWRFRAVGGVTALQEGIYLGVRGETRHTEQIVVSGATRDGAALVKWAINRVAADT